MLVVRPMIFSVMRCQAARRRIILDDDDLQDAIEQMTVINVVCVMPSSAQSISRCVCRQTAWLSLSKLRTEL